MTLFRWADYDYNVDEHLSVEFPDELVPKLRVIPEGSRIQIRYSYDPGAREIIDHVHGSIPADPAELDVSLVRVKEPGVPEYREVKPEELFAVEWFITEYAYDQMLDACSEDW
jgi:hypothetical protein